MDKHYIKCLDEGHGPVAPAPLECDASTALMVNPDATQSVLLDAAKARVARIIDVTHPWLELEVDDFDFAREDAIRMLISICGMAQEVKRLLDAGQTKEPWGLEPMRESYRQAIEGAEALARAVNIVDLGALPEGKQEVIANAILEMEGHIGAARDDFIGRVEVSA